MILALACVTTLASEGFAPPPPVLVSGPPFDEREFQRSGVVTSRGPGDSATTSRAEPRWRGLLAGGVVLIVYGGGTAVTGVGFLAEGRRIHAACVREDWTVCGDHGSGYHNLIGWPLLAGGLAILAGGIPMVVVAQGRKQASITVQPDVGLESAGIRLDASW